METHELSEIFSLFNNLSEDTFQWLLPMTQKAYYEPDQVIISEQSWGRAIYLIMSGWVKLQTRYGDEMITVEIIGKGGFVGEAGILGNIHSHSHVIAISTVEVLTISAQRFLQILARDSKIQNRLLKATIARAIEYEKYCQFYRQTPKVRLAYLLIYLAEKYGIMTEKGVEIYSFLVKDLADLAQLTVSDCHKIINKLLEKKLIEIDKVSNSLYLTNIKHLNHIIGKLGN